MNMRDLIPWGRGSSQPDIFREEPGNPFLTLHREMNRLFDETFRGLEMPSLFGARAPMGMGGWPKLEGTENDKEICVIAELPGLDEKDVDVSLSDGTLCIRGERKSEVEDKDRQFSERYYGRFERRIPVGMEIDEDKIEASFKNGVLKVTLPKTERAQTKAKRIEINAPTKH